MSLNFELSTTQKGKIGEALVASTLMRASGGRLSPFTAHSDDCGIDLIILDKKTARTLCLQVKCRSEKEQRRPAQFNVRKTTLRDGPNCYLLAFFFNPENPALTQSWFIPMAQVPALAVEKADKFAIAPSPDLRSRDRYIDYRQANAGNLVTAIIRALEPRTPI